MRIAGHTLGTPDVDLPAALRLFHDVGLDAAEVICQDGYPAGIVPADHGSLRRAARAADASGVEIVALTPYTTGINSLDPATRAGAVDDLRASVDAAQELGASRVRVYGGAWQDGQPDATAHWSALVESMVALADHAADSDVVLCVENHFGTMTRTAEATAHLVREVNSPHVRVLYDQANLTFTHDEDYRTALAVQGDLVAHVHVKDLVFKDASRPFVATETARVREEERAVASRVVGDGILPWADILAALSEIGYDGILSIEYEYRWHPQDLLAPVVGFARSAEALRGYLTAVTEVAR